MSEVIVLYDGYSFPYVDDSKTASANSISTMIANCSCSLIKGPDNMIVDTMTPWDSEKIMKALQEHGVKCEEIQYVISTHGHSDHIGNNNLFLNAKHIVGFSISYKEKYFLHPFDKGEEFIINEGVKVIPTPGHTLSDVTVLVTNKLGEIEAIAGDLFENELDIEDPNIWIEAGSEDPSQQRRNRLKVAELANWIVPGHGPRFQVTTEIRQALERQVDKIIAVV